MDVRRFVADLLAALAEAGCCEQVVLETEGPVAKGRAYARADLFLRFYFNEITGTLAFALIPGQGRVWGIDFDKLRGWHLHPQHDPASHVAIDQMSVFEIVALLKQVVAAFPSEA
jgi:hypothetical protein